jgi:N-acetylglucosaminyl-diphospho-decaprenol L-rhamnosyltransferase
MARSPLTAAPGQPGCALLGFVACGAVVRREAFLAVGGFSTRLIIGGEEELLSRDLVAAGWTLSYVAEVVAHHHPSRLRSSAQRRAADARNGLWTAWLRRPVRSALGVTAGTARRALRDPQVARGMLEAARGLRWVRAGRRPDPPHVEEMCRTLERARFSG